MARGIRIEYFGAVYHVMCRGDQRKPIFRSDADRELFLTTLGEACEQTGWRIHAYVLMRHHYHWEAMAARRVRPDKKLTRSICRAG